MELKNLKMEKVDSGAEMNVKHPVTKEPTDMFLTLMGKDSKAFRAIELAKTQEVMDSMMEQQSNSRGNSKGRKPAKATLRADKEISDMVKKYSSMIVSSRGFQDGGKEYQFVGDVALEALSDGGYVWLFEQIVEFVEDRTNFFGESSVN